MLKLQDLLGHYNLSQGPDTTRFSVGIRTALPWQGENNDTMHVRGTFQNNTGLLVCQIWLDPKKKTILYNKNSDHSWGILAILKGSLANARKLSYLALGGVMAMP